MPNRPITQTIPLRDSSQNAEITIPRDGLSDYDAERLVGIIRANVTKQSDVTPGD